jgi:hypothetical protein
VEDPGRGRGVPSSEAEPARGKCCPSNGAEPAQREHASFDNNHREIGQQPPDQSYLHSPKDRALPLYQHEWPRSSDPSRGGSSAARWLAHRLVYISAAHLYAAGSTQGRVQGEERRRGLAVLTLGRRCSHCRLGVIVHVSDVGVPGGGAPSTPVPWTRTASPTTRQLPSWRLRLRFTDVFWS